MKNTKSLFLILSLLIFPIFVFADSGINKGACTFKGKKLFGKIQVVESFPDIKVQIVTAFPDLQVKIVDAFPDSCGEWQMTDSFPDLKIQFVESFPDIKIEYVTAFPGVK